MHACLLATISGISLPIGAILGIILSPVRDVVSAAWVAFGAGALLFAVTVELYGHDLRELENGRVGIYEMVGTICGAYVGALFYLYVNRWLEETMEEESIEDLDDVESDGHSQVGDMTMGCPTEATPFLAKSRADRSSPNMGFKTPHPGPRQLGDNTAGFCPRDESFAMTYNCSLNPSRNVSFSQYPYSRNVSFAFSECSFKSRGRDRAINMLAIPIGSDSSKESSYGDSRATSVAGDQTCLEMDLTGVNPGMTRKGNNNKLAFSIFLGLLVDGVPEGILMGCLAAEGHFSWVLVLSLMVANFPEAFSSASLMVQGGISVVNIISMWTGLCVMVGALAGASCYLLQLFFPSYPHGDLPQTLLIGVAVVEGLTGGAMISCIATVMLPEAFARSSGRDGWLITSSGFLCTAGFLTAVTMKAFEHHYNQHYHEQHAGHLLLSVTAM